MNILKRVVLFLLTLMLFAPASSFADDPEGVFVPNYQAFMNAFVPKVEAIDPDYAAKIREECFVNGKWTEPSSSNNYVYYYYLATDLRIYEGNDFLNTLYINIPKKNMEKEEDVFKQLILAAATSIIPDAGEEFEQNLFSNLHYDYVKESPAGYITMYWNCGVYLFQFNKSSDEYSFEISLSLYEVQN